MPVEGGLRERLRGAVAEATASAGRGGITPRMAIEVAAPGLARTLRRGRRVAVETTARFRLALRPCGSDGANVGDAVAALVAVFGEAAAHAALQTGALPMEIAPPEDEACQEDGATPELLPGAAAAWRRARRLQDGQPLVSGVVATVALRWRVDPPTAPAGQVWAWGPYARSTDDEALCRLLAKEIGQGAIEAVAWSGVDVVTPIFVVRHPVTGKARLVHDLRAVNALLAESTVAYGRAREALDGSRVAAKLDVLSAFRHCGLRVRDRRRLGFVIGDRVFRWKVLPFGASQSPELFCSAFSGFMAGLREVRSVVYVDDVLILAPSRERLDEATTRLIDEMRLAGWYIALDKTFPYACTVIPFLGVLVDLGLGCLRVSVAKAAKLQALCAAVLAGTKVSLAALQKIGGLLAFLATAVPDCKFGRLGIDRATAEAERLPGRTVGVKGRLADDLRFWRDEAPRLPGRRPTRPGEEWVTICSDAAGAPLRGFGGVVWCGAAVTPDLNALFARREDLASDDAIAVFGPLSLRSDESSSSLETEALDAIVRHLLRVRPGWVRNRRISWFSDSQVAVRVVTDWRAKSVGLLRALRQLFELVRGCNAVVEPRWVARHLGWMPAADFLSRLWWRRAAAEWTVPSEIVGQIVSQAGWQPTVDLFATRANAQCSTSASRFPEAGRWADAFARPWDNVRGWAFPPFSQLPRVWQQVMVAHDARVLVVCPVSALVPGAVRVVSRFLVPQVPLIDIRGESPTEPGPDLVVVDVRSNGSA